MLIVNIFPVLPEEIWITFKSMYINNHNQVGNAITTARERSFTYCLSKTAIVLTQYHFFFRANDSAFVPPVFHLRRSESLSLALCASFPLTPRSPRVSNSNSVKIALFTWTTIVHPNPYADSGVHSNSRMSIWLRTYVQKINRIRWKIRLGDMFTFIFVALFQWPVEIINPQDRLRSSLNLTPHGEPLFSQLQAWDCLAILQIPM
jgi:hypothetical protein